MSGGWIKLHRELLDWEWYDDANTFRLFMHLLLRVNHQDKKWHGINIVRGSLLSSPDQLAAEIGLSRQNVRTSIKKLKSTNELTTTATAKYTVFSITKYDSYQEPNQQANQQLTSSQPATNQQLTTTKECKNVKKEDNTSPILADDVSETSETEKPKPKFNTEQMRFAEFMLGEIRKINPHHKKPNLEAWANTVRLMVEADKRPLRESAKLFRWTQEDTFWQPNILSPKKFREKWDMLAAKKESESHKGKDKHQELKFFDE